MIRKVARNESGQAVTEFAVILPVLLLVLFAIFQFGIIFNNYIQVTAAAREGARKGAVNRTTGNCAAVVALATSAAKSSAPGLNWTTSGAAVNATDTCTSNALAQGSDFTITANYPWSVSLMGIVVGSGTLSSSTTMRVE
jgi:Flp pilus assembly protein TadG